MRTLSWFNVFLVVVSATLVVTSIAHANGNSATPNTIARSAHHDACVDLSETFHRADTTITVSKVVAAGSFATPTSPSQAIGNLPPYCRVAGFMTPTGDSHIQFEVWLPESHWNQKYLQVGCGGFCGNIFYGSMGEALRREYAVAATDDGHSGGGARWALHHPQRVIDFAYRAVKETTELGKALASAFYDSPLRHSYFMGCSDGGREALMEAQRYPLDFDGIIAGDPASDWTRTLTGMAWDQAALRRIPGGDLSQSDLDVLSKAMLAQCAGRDGGLRTDQFLSDPPACRFDPKKLPLTEAKIEAIDRIFSGPRGIPGYAYGGAEANDAYDWPHFITGSGNPDASAEYVNATNFFRYMVFDDFSWTPASVIAAQNLRQADQRVGAILNDIDPDLRAFRLHGGKLIEFEGWSDSAIPPQLEIDYFRALERKMGAGATQRFYRLYMVPGMGHCFGGRGANAFGQFYPFNGPNPSDPADDILSALDSWVVNGMAPHELVATKYRNDNPAQGIIFQRPLCPFPEKVKYRTGNDPSAASSFECVHVK
jgi:Tannase and feruloyl esterase